MKAEQGKGFAPIFIKLETQEEVDALFALGNYTRTAGISPIYRSLRDVLDEYMSDGYQKFHDKLCETFRNII